MEPKASEVQENRPTVITCIKPYDWETRMEILRSQGLGWWSPEPLHYYPIQRDNPLKLNFDIETGVVLDSLTGIAQKDDEIMAKFKDKVEIAIAPPPPKDTYTSADGTKHVVEDMVDEHLQNAAMKIIKENKVAMGEGTTEQKISRLCLVNRPFQILYKEINKRGL